MIHKWRCEGEGEAGGEQGRAGDQVERRGRWGEEVADHDDDEDDEDDGDDDDDNEDEEEDDEEEDGDGDGDEGEEEAT